MPTETKTASAGLGPNAGLINQQGSRRALATPAVILDLDILDRNIAAMADLCREAGLGLRPHAKTHKSVALSRLQVGAGALGVCCATLREARAMVGGGIPGILVTTPIVAEAKMAELAKLNTTADGLMTVVDNPGNARDLEGAVAKTGRPLTVLVDVDIGMARTGVANPAAAVELARFLSASPHLHYGGIQGYSGKVQHLEPYADRAETYGKQLQRLKLTRNALTAEGLEPARVSGGGTGTFAIDREAGVLTEHQAGSYIFMDVEYNDVELFPDRPAPYGTALFIDCTVVSNNAAGFVTTDGGFKCFSADGPLPTVAAGPPEGATFRYFGDEYGCITFARPDQTMALGEKVSLVTPHCDPTVNMHDYYHCIRGNTLVDIWPVDARGTL